MKNDAGVDVMLYSGIDELLSSNREAHRFFDGLPKDVQNTLRRYGGGINSFEELKHFSDVACRRR